MSNRLNPNQARQFVGPDLGPNFLQRSSADAHGKSEMANMFTYFLFQWLNDELIVKKLVNSITIEYDEDVSTQDKPKN